MDFEDKVKRFADSYDMFGGVTDIVTGVSGGADSVTLLLLLDSFRRKAGFRIHAVHINHMIRGASADRDEEFVRRLTSGMEGVTFTAVKVDVPRISRECGMTEEEAGRAERYKAFNSLADQLEAEGGSNVRIAVAHNKNDLAETVLMNEIRGSSLRGLGGIRPVRGRIIRPLLDAERTEIEDYLKQRGEEYVTDETNLENDYLRNRIRNIVMPELIKANGGTVRHLATLASDIWDMYPDEDAAYSDGDMVLNAIAEAAGRRKDITRKHVEAVMELAEKESGSKVSLPYGLTARNSYGRIIIESSGGSEAGRPLKRYSAVIMDRKGISISKDEYTKTVDYDIINAPIVFRTPEDGDYVVISSEGGRKSLKKLFTDMKVERSLRTETVVAAPEGSNDIIWVVGLRLSEKYKVKETTEKIAVLRAF